MEIRIKDLLNIAGGNTKVRIVGTNSDDQYVDLWEGIVDDIDFRSVPFGHFKIQHCTVINGEDDLLLIIDDNINFRDPFNSENEMLDFIKEHEIYNPLTKECFIFDNGEPVRHLLEANSANELIQFSKQWNDYLNKECSEEFKLDNYKKRGWIVVN